MGSGRCKVVPHEWSVGEEILSLSLSSGGDEGGGEIIMGAADGSLFHRNSIILRE